VDPPLREGLWNTYLITPLIKGVARGQGAHERVKSMVRPATLLEVSTQIDLNQELVE
jgi:hypothetical protein